MVKGSYRRRGETSWEIRFSLGKNPVTKKYEYYRETFHGTEEECQNRVDDLAYEFRHGKTPKNSSIILADFLDYYYENFAIPQLKRSTQRQYKQTMDDYIKPYPIARYKIKDLTPLHVERHYNELRKTKSPGIVLDVHTVLSSAMRQAYIWDYIENKFKIDKVKPIPTKELQVLKKQAKKRRKTWKSQQVLDFLEWIRSRGLRRYFIYLIASTLGVRRGENLALKWTNIHFDKEYISLEGSITENVYEEYLKVDYRNVFLFPFLRDELEKYKDIQDQEKEQYRDLYSSEGWVHADQLGNLLMRPDSITHRFVRDIAEFNKERESRGLEPLPRIAFHDLRHTCGSLLYNYFGVPLEIIAEILGHKSGAEFLRETYIEDDVAVQREAFKGFDDMFVSTEGEWKEAAKGRGMCTKCSLSELRISDKGAKKRYCLKYDNWCAAIARSCEGAVS